MYAHICLLKVKKAAELHISKCDTSYPFDEITHEYISINKFDTLNIMNEKTFQLQKTVR